MARQGFTSADGPDFPPASFTAVANTLTRTNLWTPNLWSFIPAFDLRAGKAYVLRAGGIYSTTATPTIIFNPTFGQSATPASNIALGVTSTFTTTTVTNASWHSEFILGCRQVGVAAATSTVTGNGFVLLGGAAAAASAFLACGTTVVTTADQTTAQGLCLDVTWGTAAAGNTITTQWVQLQSLN
jgi:hypothetical protein